MRKKGIHQIREVSKIHSGGKYPKLTDQDTTKKALRVGKAREQAIINDLATTLDVSPNWLEEVEGLCEFLARIQKAPMRSYLTPDDVKRWDLLRANFN